MSDKEANTAQYMAQKLRQARRLISEDPDRAKQLLDQADEKYRNDIKEHVDNGEAQARNS